MYQESVVLLLNDIPFYGYATFSLPIYQLMDVWIVSNFGPIVSNASMNICQHIFVWT